MGRDPTQRLMESVTIAGQTWADVSAFRFIMDTYGTGPKMSDERGRKIKDVECEVVDEKATDASARSLLLGPVEQADDSRSDD